MENQFSRSISHRHVWLTLLVWLKRCLPFCPLKPHHWVINWVMTSKQTSILSSPSKGDKNTQPWEPFAYPTFRKRKIIDSKVPFVGDMLVPRCVYFFHLDWNHHQDEERIICIKRWISSNCAVGSRAKEWLEYLSNPLTMGSVELPTLMFSTSYHYLYRCYSLCSHWTLGKVVQVDEWYLSNRFKAPTN